MYLYIYIYMRIYIGMYTYRYSHRPDYGKKKRSTPVYHRTSSRPFFSIIIFSIIYFFFHTSIDSQFECILRIFKGEYWSMENMHLSKNQVYRIPKTIFRPISPLCHYFRAILFQHVFIGFSTCPIYFSTFP